MVRKRARRACSELAVVKCFRLVDGGKSRWWPMVIVWNVLLRGRSGIARMLELARISSLLSATITHIAKNDELE